MSNLISRQEAIDTSLEFFVEFLGGALHENAQKELIARFQRLSSAQPEADEVARDMATIIENEKDMRVIRENAEYQWIPCSKKMPPVHGIFLASIRTLSSFTYVATVTHDDKGRPFCFETGPLYPGSYEMIAWRPLPDPYEGENDG